MGFRSLSRRLESDPTFRELMDEEYPYRRVADAVVELRAMRGLTQADLARMVDTPQPVIARLESGKHAIRADLLNRIAAAVGMVWAPQFVAAVPQPAQATWALAAPGALLKAVPKSGHEPMIVFASKPTGYWRIEAHREAEPVERTIRNDAAAVEHVAPSVRGGGRRPVLADVG